MGKQVLEHAQIAQVDAPAAAGLPGGPAEPTSGASEVPLLAAQGREVSIVYHLLPLTGVVRLSNRSI